MYDNLFSIFMNLTQNGDSPKIKTYTNYKQKYYNDIIFDQTKEN